MIKKKTKKFGSIMIMTLLMVFMLSNVVYAAVIQNGTDVKFTKHFVDSNQYTKVAEGAKKNAGKTLYVTVTNMYDSDGTMQDSWTRTKWQVYDDQGYLISDEITIVKGEYTGISLYEKVTSENLITVKAKGNIAWLDAKISGYLHNFTKN